MPTEIKSSIFRPSSRPAFDPLPQEFKWLQRQQFDYDRYVTGTGPRRPGSTGGGLSGSQYQQLARWQQNATVPDPPRITKSILNGKKQPRVGALTLNMIDPIATVSELTGSFLGREEPLVGEGGQWDPVMYLNSKGIDLFGIGSTGAPARLADYAVAPFIAAGQMLTGQRMPDRNIWGDLPYGFQRDPSYWAVVTQLDDEEMRRLAWNVVARQADPASNQYLVDMLTAQFQNDKKEALGLTSGTESTDYFAKKGLTMAKRAGWDLTRSPGLATFASGEGFKTGSNGEVLMQSGFFRSLPFVGPWWAEAINPLTDEEEQAWLDATPEERTALLGSAGASQMVNELPGWLVLGSAVGGIASAARGAPGLAGAAYKGYSVALGASKVSMATGLTVATANWALQAAWPEDFDFGPITGQGVSDFTQRVDLARPVSQSQLAGVVNALGFWSSGTFGAATAVEGGKRLVGKVAGAAAGRGVPVPRFGMPDRHLFAFGLGGSDMRRFAVDHLGLAEQGITLSAKRLWLSETLNQIRERYLARWEAAIGGLPTGSYLDDLPVEQRVELAGQQMSRPLSEASSEVEAIVRTYTLADSPKPLIEDAAIVAHGIATRNARSHDDGLARRFVTQYGAPFMARLAGRDTPEALREWLADAVTRLGGTADGLPSPRAHSLEWWHQLTRTVYHYAFDRWAGLIHAAAEGTEEQARLSVMSSRHLFRDQADDAIRVLRGDDAELARQVMDDLAPKIEVEEWHAKGIERSATRRRGADQAGPWRPTPASLADHLEDIRETLATRRTLPDAASDTAGEPLNLVHRQMSEEGLWEIGYKPVNEAGEFVASVQTRTNQTVFTHWLDYPLSNTANIEMGNRGMLASKIDAVTRGYRTWRILEMQRGALFRSLSERGIGSPTQIEQFHQGVLRLSRRHALSPQAVGRAPRWFPGMDVMADEVDTLARRVFGQGPHFDQLGRPIDWRREIGQAYRTAYRLNATTGLTSHLKASLGPLGEAIVLTSDFMYVAWRFGLSPLFKAGEIWESFQLGMMRRVNPRGDPAVEAMYYRTGIGGDPQTISQELTGDMLLQGLGREFGDPRVPTSMSPEAYIAQRRLSASLSFYARQLPEDFADLQRRLALRNAAEQFRARAMAGQALRPATRREALVAELLDLVDETGFVTSGNESRFREVVAELDYEELDPFTRQALDAWPEGGPSQEALDRAARYEGAAASLRRRETQVQPRSMPRVPTIGDDVDWATPPGAAAAVDADWRFIEQKSGRGVPGSIVAKKGVVDYGYGPDRMVRYIGYDEAGHPAGHLDLELDPSLQVHRIAIVAVRPDVRRAGIATALYDRAIADGYDIMSLADNVALGPARTTAGKAFRATYAPQTRPPSDVERLAQYEHLIDEGMLPKDPQMELRRRYRATIDEIERAFGPQRLHGYSADRALLVDPVTGVEFPEFAGPTWPGSRDTDRVLRSLRARMGRVRVDVPTWEDMAIRVEARAEALRAPVPLTRNERVGAIVPEGYTLDSAELNVGGQEVRIYADDGSYTTQHGVPSWLDIENTGPEDRGLWHATTSIDAVMDTGLLSRQELLLRSTPPDAVEALRQAYEIRGLPPSDIRIERWDGTVAKAPHESLRDVIHGDAGVLEDQWTGQAVPWSDIRRIKDNDDKVLWQSAGRGTGGSSYGLGASRPDRLVSVTTDYVHAQTIAERLRFVSSVARDELDAEDILDHFATYYDDLTGGDLATITEMASALGVPDRITAADTEVAYKQLADAMNERARHASGTPGGAADYLFDSVKVLDHRLDMLGRQNGVEGFSGGVLLVGGREQYAKIDPNQVGMVQVAARTYRFPPLDEATFRQAATAAFDTPLASSDVRGETIRAQHSNGGVSAFIRWDPVMHREPGGRMTYTPRVVNGQTERQAFEKWLDDIADDVRQGQADPIIGVSMPNADTQEQQVFAGSILPEYDRLPRSGPDRFELQYDSRDLFVLDDRITGEPLAADERGLLRQLRQTIDEQGTPVPGLEARHNEVIDRLSALRDEVIDPTPASRMSDVYGTPENVTQSLEDAVAERISGRRWPDVPAFARKAWDTLWDPVPLKERQMAREIIQLQREEFPRVIGNMRAAQVFREVAGPESGWADFLVRDRELMDRWLQTGDVEDLDALIAHAGGDPQRRAMDELYRSEEWSAITSLWALNAQGAAEEAFQTHFFDQYRSPLLRSINHPVLGIYPASWALKTAREWAKFLFDNRMFGVDLRMGMTPAVALAQISRQQAVAYAQAHPEAEGDLNAFLEDGPLGSTLFVFNLLMPGDWAALPFSLSRSLREVVRGNYDPGQILQRNIDYLGVTRDARLGSEMMGEWRSLVFGPDEKPGEGPWLPLPPSSSGIPTYVKPRVPPSWSEEPRR